MIIVINAIIEKTADRMKISENKSLMRVKDARRYPAACNIIFIDTSNKIYL
jgi:hypothetical protein